MKSNILKSLFFTVIASALIFFAGMQFSVLFVHEQSGVYAASEQITDPFNESLTDMKFTAERISQNGQTAETIKVNNSNIFYKLGDKIKLTIVPLLSEPLDLSSLFTITTDSQEPLNKEVIKTENENGKPLYTVTFDIAKGKYSIDFHVRSSAIDNNYIAKINSFSRTDYELPTIKNAKSASNNENKAIFYYDGSSSGLPMASYKNDIMDLSIKLTKPNAQTETIYEINSSNSKDDTSSAGRRLVYLSEFGEYTLTYNYIDENLIATGATNLTFEQKVYLFGAKNMYRSELKLADETTQITNKEMVDFLSEQTSRTDGKTSPTITASTNQVPVWFNFYGAMRIANVTFTATGSNTSETLSFTAQTRFSKAGAYKIHIELGTPDLEGIEYSTFSNDFEFMIRNSNPEVTLTATSNYMDYNNLTTEPTKVTTILNADGYTNGNVTLTAQELSTFDKPYKLFYTYKNNIIGESSLKEIKLINGQFAFPVNDVVNDNYLKYTVHINFGADTTSKVLTTFTIDKTSIKIVPKINGVENGKESFGITDANSKFSLSAFRKESGAAVTATMRYLGFKTVTANPKSFTELDEGTPKSYVETNYTANKQTTFNPYALGYMQTSNPSQNSEGLSLTEPGFYEFEVLDSAYNTSFYYVFIDNYTPNIIYQQVGQGTDNFKHLVTYGDYKALNTNIDISTFKAKRSNVIINNSIEADFNQSIFASHDSDNNGKKELYLRTATTGYNDTNTQRLRKTGLESNGPITNYKNTSSIPDEYYRFIDANHYYVYNNVKGNEGGYNYGIRDINNNASASGFFSISFDLANVTINAKAGSDDNSNNYANQVFPNMTHGSEVEGTNFDIVQFASANINGATTATTPSFDLLTITVDFYKKTNNIAGLYETTPSRTSIYDSANSINIINSQPILAMLNNISQEGKIVVSWSINVTSSNNSSGLDGNDLYDANRSQYIIIDRTGIVDTLGATPIGANTKLAFQNGTANSKQLNITTDNSSKLKNGQVETLNVENIVSSNLTPIETIFDSYKFARSAITAGSTEIDNAIVNLFKTYSDVNVVDNGSVVDNQVYPYTAKGVYDVVISDNFNSLILKNGKSKPVYGNAINYKFSLTHTRPPASFTNTQINSGTSINNQIISHKEIVANGYGVYETLSVDETIASVKRNVNGLSYISFVIDDLTVYETNEHFGFDQKQYDFNAKVNPNEVLINGIKTQATNTIKLDDGRNRYIFDISVSSSNDAVYDIKAQYMGNSTDFGFDKDLFFTQTYRLYVDGLSPNYNLNNLQSQDTFYNTYVNIENSKLTKEQKDLYFYILPTDFKFTLKPAQLNSPSFLDTYKIFYREVNQPITGDNNTKIDNTKKTIFSKVAGSTNPVFDESKSNIYVAFNYSDETLASNILSKKTLYEIIELDEAGNGTSYFVHPGLNGIASVNFASENFYNSEEFSSQPTIQTKTIQSGETTAQVFAVTDNYSFQNINTDDNFFEINIKDKLNKQNVFESMEFVNTNKETSLTNLLKTKISQYLNDNNLRSAGAVFEISIKDRFSIIDANNYNFIKFELFLRPTPVPEFKTSTLSDTQIQVIWPDSNSSYAVTAQYFGLDHSDINGFFTDDIILDTTLNQNFKITYSDNYGQTKNYFFSSKKDLVEFNVIGTAGASAVTDPVTGKVYYGNTLVFDYHPTFRDSDAIEVWQKNNALGESDFTQITDIVKNPTETVSNKIVHNTKEGRLTFPKIDNTNIEYKVIIEHKFDKDENGLAKVETIYANYYTLLPAIVATGFDNLPIAWTPDVNNIESIRTIFAQLNFNVINIDKLVDTKMMLTEKAFTVDGNEKTFNYGKIQSPYSLQITGTNYKRREFTLTVSNLLGISKTYKITIDIAQYPIYQVVKNGEPLKESSLKFSLNENDGTRISGSQYFSNDKANTKLVLAEDKPSLKQTIYKTVNENGNDYVIYHITSDNPTFVHDEYVKVNYVLPNANAKLPDLFLTNSITDKEYTSAGDSKAQYTLTQKFNYQGFRVANIPIGLDYYAEIYVNGTLVTNNIDGVIKFSDAGVYKIAFKDIAGNTHMFDSETSMQTINLINAVVMNVSSDNYTGELVDGMALENEINLSVANYNLFIANSLTISATYNGNVVEAGLFTTFKKAGVYVINLEGKLKDTTVKSEYKMYLVKPNEQRLGLEFVLNNSSKSFSKIVQVYQRDAQKPTASGTDVTRQARDKEGILNNPNAPLTKLRLSSYEFQNGLFTTNINITFSSIYKSSINYSFKVLILDSEPILKSNVTYGTTVTKNIKLTYTPSEIFENYGAIIIKVGNQTTINITADSINDTEEKTITIKEAGTYNIDAMTESGMILSRYTITKKDPLNATAIIIIVLGSAALITGILLFFKLRTKMKVR